MPQGAHQITLTDATGQPHTYTITPLLAGEGLEVLTQLLGLLAGPAVELLRGALLDGVADKLAAAAAGEGSALDTAVDVAALLRGLDFEQLKGDVQRALLAPSAAPLVRRILSSVDRDNRSLRDDATFDLAFQANYWELAQILWEAVKINRFFPASLTSPDAPEAE